MDRRNWDRVYQKTNNNNMMVCYHREKLQILTTFFQFPNMTHTQLIENLLTVNKRDVIPPFCLLTYHHVIHYWERENTLPVLSPLGN